MKKKYGKKNESINQKNTPENKESQKEKIDETKENNDVKSGEKTTEEQINQTSSESTGIGETDDPKTDTRQPDNKPDELGKDRKVNKNEDKWTGKHKLDTSPEPMVQHPDFQREREKEK